MSKIAANFNRYQLLIIFLLTLESSWELLKGFEVSYWLLKALEGSI